MFNTLVALSRCIVILRCLLQIQPRFWLPTPLKVRVAASAASKRGTSGCTAVAARLFPTVEQEQAFPKHPSSFANVHFHRMPTEVRLFGESVVMASWARIRALYTTTAGRGVLLYKIFLPAATHYPNRNLILHHINHYGWPCTTRRSR
jgi:hypothetical protein